MFPSRTFCGCRLMKNASIQSIEWFYSRMEAEPTFTFVANDNTDNFIGNFNGVTFGHNPPFTGAARVTTKAASTKNLV